MPAGKVLAAGLVCFLVWTLLQSTSMERSIRGAPLGARRSAALLVLEPLAKVSRATGIDRVAQAVNRVLGRDRDAGTTTLLVAPPASAAAPASGSPTSPPPGAAASSGTTSTPPTAGGSGTIPTPSPSAPRDAPAPASFFTPEPPPPPVPAIRTPTKADPLRVLVVGDSLGIDVGLGMARVLESVGPFVVSVDGAISTGLARPDYFDWPARLRADLATVRPDIVVVMLGANDPQDMSTSDGRVVIGTKAWAAEYRARIGAFMDEAMSGGAGLVWVGMPVMRSAGLSNAMQRLNDLYRAEAAERPTVLYVDTWRLLSKKPGSYDAYLPTGSGDVQLVREPDGIHINPGGSDRTARIILRLLRETWRLPA
jgi:uncharacterized protein